MQGPQIENNSSGGTSFTFSALSGRFETNNPSSINIFARSNLLFAGDGFTRATAVVSPPPVIHGFSEVISGTTFLSAENGRNLSSTQVDLFTDDAYLYSSSTGRNERISKSTFGFPVNFLPSSPSAMPSNRFPSISGDGRHVLFSSDATESGGLAFLNTNQQPLDQNNVRDIYHHDRKTIALPPPNFISAQFINPSPTDNLLNFYPLGAVIEISVSVTAEIGTVEQINLFLNGQPLDLPIIFLP